MLSSEINWSKSDIIAAFEPSLATLVMFLDRKYGYKHSLIEKVSLFDEIYNAKSSYSLLLIFYSEKKPIIISVCVKIILYQHKILFLGTFKIEIGPTKVSTLKIRVDSLIIMTAISQ